MSQRSAVMVQSPGSINLNTPGQSGTVASPLNPQEEQLYREKYRQLTKYIEPLKAMMARMGSDDEKVTKISKLLEILCNPHQRIPIETLLKCETALERMNLSSMSSSFSYNPRDGSVTSVLLDAVNTNLQSPIGNHTLQKTFRPSMDSLFGSDIK